MLIQGDLQAVFDALYSVGAIDPVLKMDWAEISEKAQKDVIKLENAILAVNHCDGDREALVQLMQRLNLLEPNLIQYIAVEVAREFAEFSSRSELH
jgi:phosphoglucomutase